MKTRRIGIMVMLGLFLATAFLPMSAYAGRKGRRNTAIALTGAALYFGLNDHPKTAAVVGAGAAYAWSRVGKKQNHHRVYSKRHHRDRGNHCGWYRGKRSHGKHWAKHNRHHSYRCARH